MEIVNKTTDVEGKTIATVSDGDWSITLEVDNTWTDEQIIDEAQRMKSINSATEPQSISPESILHRLESLYYNMLTNEWTNTLRQYGFISPDYTITPQNTNELQNIDYLLRLREIDISAYDMFAGEFDRFKAAITQFGVAMSDVMNR